jgi:hypothetical protein
MLSTILLHPEPLVAFITLFNLALYQAQTRHLLNLVDAILVCNGKKTLSNLYRQIAGEPDPKTAADFFRESPWEREDIGRGRKEAMLLQFLAFAQKLGLNTILVGLDDSTGQKDKATRHLEVVCFHHNHNDGSKKKPVFVNGFVYVAIHLQIGPIGFTWDTRLYLREKVVRQLNRKRQPDNRLHYRSKYALAQAMLTELARLLPKDYKIYVLFDSWYSSAKLLKFCRRQGWQVVCAIKSNRRIDKQRIDLHNQALKHKRYQKVVLQALHPPHPAPVYYVRTVKGHLEEFPAEVCAIISKRHPGDPRPKFFLTTDLSLSAQEALRLYQRRWPVEIDNFYLKEGLGVADFRLQSFEATDKWLAVTLVSLNYLQFQQAQSYVETGTLPCLADLIRQHRWTHLESVIRRMMNEALETGNVEEVIQRHLPTAAWAVV